MDVQQLEKAVSLESLLRPRGIEEQLAPGLDALGLSFGKYRDSPSSVLYFLKEGGYVVRPELAGAHDEQCGTLVGLIDGLKPQQALIIPYGADIFPDVENKARLTKKDNILRVARFYNLDENLRKPVCELVMDALKAEKLSDVYFAIDFKGVQETIRKYRVFTLFDCIRADIADSVLATGAVTVYLYTNAKKALQLGGEARVIVPSFSGGEKKRVRLHHMPVYLWVPDAQQIRTSFDFYATDTCERAEFFTLKYGRKTVPLFSGDERLGDEELLDHHAILAFMRASQRIAQTTEYNVLPMFPKPNNRTEDFFFKLNNQVSFEAVEETPEGNHVHRFPLGTALPFMEMMLHKMVAYNNEKRSAKESGL